MGLLTRPLLRAQQRFDLEDFNLALSALRTDAHFHTQRFLSAQSYILQGFTISNAFIGQSTADLTLTNATLINGNNTGDVSWWTAPTGADPITLPTGVGGLQAGRNYLEIRVYSEDGTPLQRAFWDPSANSGQGLEFTQEVDTVTEMFVEVVINQTGFTGGNPNLIPVAIIDLDGSLNIRGVQDERKLFHRLGTPSDIDAGFVWGSRTEPATTLVFNTPAVTPFVVDETVTFASGATAVVLVGGTNNIQVFDFSTDNYQPGDTATGGTSGATATVQSYYEAFTGADKDIRNQRDMFAALMSEIRTVKGTRFWYEIGTAASLPSLLNLVNTMLVPVSSGARFSWNGTSLAITDNMTTGQATSDTVAAIRVPGYAGNLLVTREDGTGGSARITIPTGSILFVNLPTAGSSRSYSESGPGTTNYQVVALADFVPSDSNYIIAYREGTKLIIPGTGELESGEDIEIGDGTSKDILAFIGAADETSTNPQYTTLPSSDLSNEFTTADSLTQAISISAANINDLASALLKPYQERLIVVSGSPSDDNEVQAPLLTGATFTIPTDSRNGDFQKKYTVGQGGLFIFLNCLHLTLGEDYLEVGSLGSLSSTVQLLQDLVVGDELDIRIVNPQIFGTGADDQPYFVNYIIGQNGATIPSGSLYNLGTDRLQVWRNGLAMLKTISVGDLVDRYQEPSNNSVTLAEAANSTDVFVMVNHESPNPSVTLLTGLTGTVITVPTYVIGNGALRFFRNGVLQTIAGGDYVETSTTSVTLAVAAGVSDVFKVFKSSTPPTWRQTVTGVTGTTVTYTTPATLNSPKLLVFRNGLLTYRSAVLGAVGDRYLHASTTTITLEVSAPAVPSDVFEFIYV